MGARVRRMEDPALLTGRAVFTDDIHLPEMLEAAFVRSAHAHARIRSVDASAAEAMPGVFKVVTTADLPADLRTVRVPVPGAQPGDHATVPATSAGGRGGVFRGRADRDGARRDALSGRGRRRRGRRRLRSPAGRLGLPGCVGRRHRALPRRERQQSLRRVQAGLRRRARRVRERRTYVPGLVVEPPGRRPRHREPRRRSRTGHAARRGNPVVGDAIAVPGQAERRRHAGLAGRPVARDRARGRRRVRSQDRLLRRGSADPALRDDVRPADQVGRGPTGELRRDQPGTRPVLGHDARLRRRRKDPRRARHDDPRHRRLHAVGHHQPLYFRDHGSGTLRRSGL